MKNDLDHFRKFSIMELISNQKKFREYLEFTKKNELIQEKTIILENLVSYTNEKSISTNQNTMKLLTDLTISCTFCIVHSDFEVENFFNINNFSNSFQKNILMQAINQCNERYKDRLENITMKFHFWVLLFVNKNIITTLDFSPPQSLSESEINESLNYLQNKVESSEFIKNNKYTACKIFYELGLNNFLQDKYPKALLNFKMCKETFLGIEKKSLLYFNQAKLDFFISKSELPMNFQIYPEPNQQTNKDINMDILDNIQTIESNFFKEKDDINLYQSDLTAQFNIENLTLDESKLFEFLSINEIIKYCRNTIIILLKDYSKLKETKALLAKVKEVSYSSDKKYRHLYSEEKQKSLSEQKFLMKENSFQNCLVELIEKSINDNDMYLSNNFLKILSQNILNNSLTDDMIVSGFIHSLLINFKNNFKEIIQYFNDFVEYFEKYGQNFGLMKKNQIKFINLFITIVEDYNKNNQNYSIEGKIHNELINLIFFWIQSMKEEKITRSENILQILIKSIKRLDYLKIIKHLLLVVLSFIYEKKNMVHNTKDDIVETLIGLDPKIFKIDFLLNDAPNISFKEDFKLSYIFEATNLDFYEKEIFILLYKVEKKIKEHSKMPEVEFIKRRFCLYFLEKKYTEAIKDFTRYLELSLEEFKRKYLLKDNSENLSFIDELYIEFKKLLDYTLLYKFCYCLYSLEYSFEAAIILQYTHKIDYDLAYKLIKKNTQKHNSGKLEFIWKLSYFELLANIYYKEEKFENLNMVTTLIKRTSTHQYFKKNAIRRHFKIINFLKIVESFCKLFEIK